MPLYLGKWGYDHSGNIKYTLDHQVGLIEVGGSHTKHVSVAGQLDGNPTAELPNIFYVTNYGDIDLISYYFSKDHTIAKKCFDQYDEHRSFIENISQWLLSTQRYPSIPPKPKPEPKPTQTIPQSVLDFGYYHMTYINPYTRRF